MAAAGVAVREIAGELGVGIATAYRYLRAHPCSDCAGPVVGEGERCQRCATRRSNPKRWTARELLDAITAWEQLEGRPPATMDWRPATDSQRNRWQREFPRWPPASAARIVFGSWTEMMAAAGYPPYNPPWGPEQVIDAMQRMAHELGRAPSRKSATHRRTATRPRSSAGSAPSRPASAPLASNWSDTVATAPDDRDVQSANATRAAFAPTADSSAKL